MNLTKIVFNNKSGIANLSIIPTVKDGELILDLYADNNAVIAVKNGESGYITIGDPDQAATADAAPVDLTPEVVTPEVIPSE